MNRVVVTVIWLFSLSACGGPVPLPLMRSNAPLSTATLSNVAPVSPVANKVDTATPIVIAEETKTDKTITVDPNTVEKVVNAPLVVPDVVENIKNTNHLLSPESESRVSAVTATLPPKSETMIATSKANTQPAESASYLAAEKQVRAKNYELAIAVLEQGYPQAQNNQRYQALLIKTYMRQAEHLVTKTKYQEAQHIVKKAIKLAPHDKTLISLSADISQQQQAELHYQNGMMAVGQHDNNGAIHEFREALLAKPNHTLANTQLTQVTRATTSKKLQEAKEFYENQQLDEAIRVLNELLRIDPLHSDALAQLDHAMKMKERLSGYKTK